MLTMLGWTSTIFLMLLALLFDYRNELVPVAFSAAINILPTSYALRERYDAGADIAFGAMAAAHPALLIFMLQGHPWQMEAHLFFFVGLAALTLVCDWRPIAVAVGLTADKVARSFTAFVQMPIPRVLLVDAVDLHMAFAAVDEGKSVTAVTQPFFGEGVHGEALLLVSDASADELARLMGYEPSSDDGTQLERILEMSSLLTATCIQSVLEQLEIDVLISHPVLLGRHAQLSQILAQHEAPWTRTLALELGYRFEGYGVECDLILLFHQNALQTLLRKLDLLLE